jgi:glucoamylase
VPRSSAGLCGTPAVIAATAGDGVMLSEQVWDDDPPSGQAGFTTGTGTVSATPLGRRQAQFVRLAWSTAAGRPVVACGYARRCP